MAYFHYQTVTSPFALSLEVPLHWHLVLSEFSFFREVMGSIRFGDSDFFLVPRSCCVNWSIHLSIHYELQIHHLNSLISYKIVCFLGTNSIFRTVLLALHSAGRGGCGSEFFNGRKGGNGNLRLQNQWRHAPRHATKWKSQWDTCAGSFPSFLP